MEQSGGSRGQASKLLGRRSPQCCLLPDLDYCSVATGPPGCHASSSLHKSQYTSQADKQDHADHKPRRPRRPNLRQRTGRCNVLARLPTASFDTSAADMVPCGAVESVGMSRGAVEFRSSVSIHHSPVHWRRRRRKRAEGPRWRGELPVCASGSRLSAAAAIMTKRTEPFKWPKNVGR